MGSRENGEMGKIQVQSSLLAVLLLPMLTACGQISLLGQQQVRAVDATALLTSYQPESDTSGSCRTKDVIVPDNDIWVDGTGYYAVCPTSDDTTKVAVYGQAPESDRYCVFPARVPESGAILPVVDGAGVPLMMCSGRIQGGQEFNFSQAAGYNALFIVPYGDAAAMRNCLALGNYYVCPKSFSYGQFRD